MARSHGIDAVLRVGLEAPYGTPPAAGGFHQLPLVSTTLGAEQGLLEDTQIGTGRESLDPTADVINNDGDVAVPVDTRAFGYWLKLMLGNAVDTGAGPYTHVFTSGAAALPSYSAEIGHPNVPAFFNNFGTVGNTMKIALARSGLLDATITCISQGESENDGVSLAPAATLVRGPRFAQAVGQVSKDGVQLGGVVKADFTLSNGYEKVETIRPDGLIDGADPLKVTMMGSVDVRFADMTLYNQAIDESLALSFGWTNGAASLVFALPRVFLPKTKRPVSGPGGVLATFNWQGSGAGGHVVTATLVNDIATYAA